MTNSDTAGLTQSVENGSTQPELSNNPSVSFAESDMRNLGLEVRSSSPAKRSRSERDTDDEDDRGQDSNRMDIDGSEQTPRSPKKAFGTQHVSPMPSRLKPNMEAQRNSATGMLGGNPARRGPNSVSGSEDSVESHAETSTLSADSTPPTSIGATEVGAANSAASFTEDPPSYDEQVRLVKELVTKQEMKEGAKGFAISSKWLARVQSRTTQGLHENYPKAAREGEIGPVDNSNLARNDNFYPALTNSSGEAFIPLKPGLQMSTDLEILPHDAWKLIMQWYGVAEESHVIIRYMHNTAPDADLPHFQYELYPPILTIQKLSNNEEGLTLEAMKEKNLDAPHLVASRSDRYQTFLKKAKDIANIDVATKVRVWKVLETTEARDRFSGMPTPVASRSASPAPPLSLSRVVPKLLVDLNSFTSMPEGGQREMVDIQDETANDKYNGRVELATIGCTESQTLILEEQVRNSTSEDYVSEKMRKIAAQNGVNLTLAKSTNLSVDAARQKANTGTARRSPTPSGMMTRGRANRKGKTRGCTGLVNLGNTCYMNSALQCIRSVEELTIYFLEQKWKVELNAENPLGYGGAMAKAYAGLLGSIYDSSTLGSFSPRNFKAVLGRCQPLFSGYGQQDSQEFLSFLVDGLHEDLNRVVKKPYIENPESDDKTVNDPQAIKALGEKFRSNHHARNDSVAMDLFSGFYKNTMVCPVCNKVSITFDPFSLLTLQLPIESTFQHTMVFAPLNGPPVKVEVDIDKNGSIRMLKEYVAKRVRAPRPENLVLAEIYNSKLFKLFEDAEIISESNIHSNDDLVIYELEQPPTNWPPQDKKKAKSHSFLSFNTSNDDTLPDIESPHADRMAVPITHRVKSNGKFPIKLWPSFVLITRKEAKDVDAILRKVLQRVASMTTKDIFTEEPPVNFAAQTKADQDGVHVTDEDASSDDPKVQAKSVEGDDDLVDVSMSEQTAASKPDNSIVLDPTYFVRPELRRLFTMNYMSSGNEMVPCGYSPINDSARFTSIESRMPRPASRRMSNGSRFGRNLDGHTPESSEDELAKDDTFLEAPDSLSQSALSDDDSDAVTNRPARFKSGFKRIKNTYSRKNRRHSSNAPIEEYMIRLGEGIVLDWDPDSFDALFSGDRDDEMRGSSTEIDMVTVPDPELAEKRARRAARKKSGISLDECFDETGKTEILSEENAWYCGRCKELRRASKTLEIWTVPDILVLHLKRFSSNSRLRDKVDVLVDFPTEGLDLSGRIGLPEDKSLTYDLFAVDNHYGGLGGGHYTAYAQNFFDKKWYEYNDQSVSQSDAKQSVTRAAYLLFYRRRSDKPLGPPYLQDLITRAYSSDTESSSGDDQRLDGSYSPNGLSGAAGAALQQDGAHLGSTGGRLDLESTARSALNDDPPPPYYGSNLDEGISMDDPDDPLPSLETDQPFIGPLAPNRFDTPGWSFDTLGKGTRAPPGSDNGMADDDSTTLAELDSNEPVVGDSANDRILTDFADDEFSHMEPFSDRGRQVPTPEFDDEENVRMGNVAQIGLPGDDSEGEVAEVRVSDEESASAWESNR